MRAAPASLAPGDLDGDGDTDLVVKTWDSSRGVGTLTIRRNDGGNRHASLAVRAHRARQQPQRHRLEGRAARRQPAVAARDVERVARGGARRRRLRPRLAAPRADVVRVLWPAGILQAEIPGRAPAAADLRRRSRRPQPVAGSPQPAGPTPVADRARSQALVVPVSVTWNGERFEFITDFMGGGEMGYVHAPGVLNTPDPDEFTRIARRQLAGRATAATSCASPTSSKRRCSSIACSSSPSTTRAQRRGPPARRAGVAAVPAVRAVRRRGRPAARRVQPITAATTCSTALRDSIGATSTTCRSNRIRGYAKPHALTLDLGPPRIPGSTPEARSPTSCCSSPAGPTTPSRATTSPRTRPGSRSSRRRCRSRTPRPLAHGHRRDRHSGRPAADRRRRSHGQVPLGRARGPHRHQHAHLLGSDARRRTAVATCAAPDAPRPGGADLRWRGFSAEVDAGRPGALRLRLCARLDASRRGS